MIAADPLAGLDKRDRQLGAEATKGEDGKAASQPTADDHQIRTPHPAIALANPEAAGDPGRRPLSRRWERLGQGPRP
ncbi:hypothetical protein GCM10022280_08750 [Sphingomonas swuensis]|uniref:Uncharacterized protein n=1 Tax=Sphingomonas swuensis TaxID=977800 RepID=A0ABP7SKY1_9SPHN